MIRNTIHKELVLCVIVPLFLSIALWMLLMNDSPAEKELQEEGQAVFAPLSMTVTLERVYVDGETSRETTTETIWSMEDFFAQYADFDIVYQSQNEMGFQAVIDDVSPVVKINGYFGLTDGGLLQLYEGLPEEEQVIQSFFYIDTDQLKAEQYQSLQVGVKVVDKEHYEQVLLELKEYEQMDKSL